MSLKLGCVKTGIEEFSGIVDAEVSRQRGNLLQMLVSSRFLFLM